MSGPFVDPEPLGGAGYSLYRFAEHRREQTPCGGWVPLFILVREAGPFRTAEEAMTHSARVAREHPLSGQTVMPDGGRIWKSADPDPVMERMEVDPRHDPRKAGAQ